MIIRAFLLFTVCLAGCTPSEKPLHKWFQEEKFNWPAGTYDRSMRRPLARRFHAMRLRAIAAGFCELQSACPERYLSQSLIPVKKNPDFTFDFSETDKVPFALRLDIISRGIPAVFFPMESPPERWRILDEALASGCRFSVVIADRAHVSRPEFPRRPIAADTLCR